MRRPPDHLLVLGRAAIDPNRPDPMHLLTGGIPMAREPETAKKTGIYLTVDGTPLRIKEGDVVPAGATYRDAGEEIGKSPRQLERERIAEAAEADAATDATVTTQRAKGAAPENRSK